MLGRKKHFPRDNPVTRYYEMMEQFNTVTELYPGQLLTISVRADDVMNIMNIDFTDARNLLNEIEQAMGIMYCNIRVRMEQFCEYMDIDEMLIQVFLASLKDYEPLPPLTILPAKTREELAAEPLRSFRDFAVDLRKGIVESIETREMRAKLWDEANQSGEAMASRPGPYRVIIRPFEVAQILGIHLKTAQEMLKETRKEAGLPPRAHVSIKRFCIINHLEEEEEDIRKALARLHASE
ncbi:hypothetical protein A3860_37485 [Niastella vici]|uniref:Uncharacterized protein n=1 Tax=Niastella vici TaxID=1703345 RepID=A0A1V9FM64_9BACT|nr:hypothetical protein [Niastella vici]OQP59445.1 hypothetical protein A3860_37485 [Niastella vici]